MTARTVLIGAAAFFVAGCGGGGTSPFAPPSSFSRFASPSVPAKTLFVSETYRANRGFGDVQLFEYPSGKYLGMLPAPPEGYDGPAGECLDRTGDVYIVNAENVDEYTGEGKFVRSIGDEQLNPTKCSVSATNDDLAVTNTNIEGGDDSVSIFRDARGSPKVISSGYFFDLGYISYDSAGNVFVDGDRYPGGLEQYGEIPNGKAVLEPVQLDRNIQPYRLQFDGRYVAIGSLHRKIYRASGSHIVGSTTLSGGVPPFFIAGDRMLTLNGPKKGHYYVHVYQYPKGGTPLSTIQLQHYFPSPTAGDIVVSE